MSDGKNLERLVHLIERSISPGSIVEHNVALPVLSSTGGRTAQCDIVIRDGKPPRQTISIIEVQDRNRAVDINEFRGWTVKLNEVGAQHLYCVSRHEFPQSIKEMAVHSGGSIRLITLKESEVDEIPNFFFNNIIIGYRDPDVKHIKRKDTRIYIEEDEDVKVTYEQVEEDLRKLKTNDFKFSLDKKKLIALSTLCIERISTKEDVLSETSEANFGFDASSPLYYYFNNHFIRIALKIEFTWSIKHHSILPSVLSYEQNGFGALAWVVESFYNSSRGPIWIRMPLVKKEHETYVISGMLVDFPASVEFTFNVDITKKPSA